MTSTCPNCKRYRARLVFICNSVAGLVEHFRAIEYHARAQLTGHQPRGSWVYWKRTAEMAEYAADLLEALVKNSCQKIG